MRIPSLSNRYIFRRTVITAVAFLFVFSGISIYVSNHSKNADAVSATDFNDGNIISDSVFYNKNSMTAAQIQSFLNSLIPTCLTWNNTTFVDGSGTRVGPPYVCLNNYYENPTSGATSFENGGGAFSGGVSAAQIIYDAAQKYNINPQVLLVMLKKESLGPLTSDNWPTKYQYKYAMGYACPDSGPGNSANCDAQKGGFYNQINLAAWQFNYYANHPNDYRYALGWNDIQYSPDTSCGTKHVNIQNIATLSLYIYTPYTPNAASLANYPGTATCGSYGNRNFFMYFNEWFGSTQGNRWVQLLDPRVLVTSKDTYKINPDSGAPTQLVSAGSQIAFPTKTTLANGDGCLRTQLDTTNNSNQCIKYEDLAEFTPTLTNINVDSSVAVKQNSQWTCKVNYRTLKITDQCFDPSTKINFLKKTTVASVDYLITKVDADNNSPTAFLASRFIDVSNTALPADEIRQMNLVWTCKIDLSTMQIIPSQCYDKNTVIAFSKRATIGDTQYLITAHDDTNSINSAFLLKRFVVVK